MSLYDYEDYGYTRRVHTLKPNYKFSVTLPHAQVGFKEFLHQGHRYIEGRKGTEYNLNFYNGSQHRVEVVFSVDGLSVIDGKPAGVGSTGYVVDPWQTISIPGWRINSGTVAKFVFRPQGDKEDMTYVEALRSEGVSVDTGNQGVIGCIVFKEKRVRDLHHGYTGIRGMSLNSDAGILPQNLSYTSKSAVESSTFSTNAASGTNQFVNTVSTVTVDEPIGTGFGEDVSFQTTNTLFTRDNNYVPTETQVVHYDTLQGLRRRGVPVDTVKAPNAFPASPHLNDGCRIPRKR